jgi:alkylated DNA repair dioxygenase AlkB
MHFNHVKDFLTKEESDWLYSKLLQEVPWRQVKYYKPERGLVTTPRFTYCYGFHQPEHYELYLPQKTAPLAFPSWIIPLKEYVEAHTSQTYNFILLSYYKDGSHSIGYHSDDETFLGKNPTIPSVTLGAERLFCLKDKLTKNVSKHLLSHGDLFLMQNNCQQDYMHSVPKTKNFILPRISLTFRNVLSEAGSINYYKYNYLNKII